MIQTIATWLIGGFIGIVIIAKIWRIVKEEWGIGKPPPPQY